MNDLLTKEFRQDVRIKDILKNICDKLIIKNEIDNKYIIDTFSALWCLGIDIKEKEFWKRAAENCPSISYISLTAFFQISTKEESLNLLNYVYEKFGDTYIDYNFLKNYIENKNPL